ncbi:threonine-phosphate decarboxylase CobD [Candidatus Endowatersipora endosymbiont of Watersipora subatra]|uniref:threonine-phosphate decarboxylase CobD n=1 Tax=Candidatus Endowatersipora endosymbiont of Watersipora subatra TaxID=3077946 RepID=UPI00312CB628
MIHGGSLDEAVGLYGGNRYDWLDLSTGVNPNHWPIPRLADNIWSTLPDSDAYSKAESAVRKAYSVPDRAAISLASGTQSHIQWIPFLFKPQAVAVVNFTYQEHISCWRRAGHKVYVTEGLESAERTANIIIVVNPNNPDGRQIHRDILKDLVHRLGAKGGLLIVDEAFCDVTPDISIIGETGLDGLLVLRSLGKFYGLAGVRFGSVISFKRMVMRLNEGLGYWSVSGPALAIAAAALVDQKWRFRTLKHLSYWRIKFEALLLKKGYRIVGGTDLFILVEIKNASEIFIRLVRYQILVRSFDAKPNWIRFGIPQSNQSLDRLEKALTIIED